jgi:hypothetical protein
MKRSSKTAVWVGALFLTAMVASLLGGGLVESGVPSPGQLVPGNQTQVIIGVLLELINAIAVLGIGVLMFPILGPHNENLARGYLGFRIVECVFCATIVIGPLSLIKSGHVSPEVGALAMAERASVADLLIPVFFGLGAILLYISLYRASLLPRFIPAWGLIGAALVLALNLLSTFGLPIGTGVSMVFALPIILNEIFLGIWLIAKGFNPSAVAPEAPARTS